VVATEAVVAVVSTAEIITTIINSEKYPQKRLVKLPGK
jgi:hypothetical protein